MIVNLKHESKHNEKGRGQVYVVSRIVNLGLVKPDLVNQEVMLDEVVWQVVAFEAHEPPSDLVNLVVKPSGHWRTYQDLAPHERAWVLRHYHDIPAHVLSNSEFSNVCFTDQVQNRRLQAPWVNQPSDQPAVNTAATLPGLVNPELSTLTTVIGTSLPFQPLGPAIRDCLIADGSGIGASNISDGALRCSACGSKLFKVKWMPMTVACGHCGVAVDTPKGEIVGALIRKG